MKYCFACMKKIPLMAHRCPYCREDGKETEMYIRVILVILLLAAIILGSKWYLGQKHDAASVPVNDQNTELSKALKKIGL